MFCLIPSEVEKFQAALRDGTIDPAKLSKMSSEDRHKFFSGIIGEHNAMPVNSLFESKLLLKNQNAGLVRWAKKVAGITPETRRDLLSKIARLDHVLAPGEDRQFLSDLASTKLGVGVSREEAKTIADLSKRVEETRAANLSTPEQSLKSGFTPSKIDLEHGYARYDLQKYVSDLKNNSSKYGLSDLKTLKGAIRGAKQLPRLVADVSKSIGASLDDSFALRQGYKAFFTNNKQWRKDFLDSFGNIVKGFKDHEAAQREFKAHQMADPLYDQAIKDGLAITKHEDVFPTSLPGKIPGIGRAFNASEVAYEAFAENLRMGIYKNQIRLADDLGEKMPSDFGKNIAKEVNSLTGRGGLGSFEPASGPINLAFYSLRFLKSNLDTLLLHPLGVGIGGVGSKAQIKAATNLVKIVAGTAAILKVADALKPGSVEWDPRSSDFGKIKVGDTRFEVTGGLDSLVTLAARVALNSTKSSSTGVVSKLNTGEYGAPTEKDVVVQFLTNKLSPVGSVVSDKLTGQTPTGQKVTPKGEALRLVTPLNVNNFAELKKDPNSANTVAAMLADTFGISTNTYPSSSTDWKQSTGKELTQFKSKVGEKKFEDANNQYNQKVQSWLSSNKKKLSNLPTDQATKDVTKEKAKIKKDIFKSLGFQPTR